MSKLSTKITGLGSSTSATSVQQMFECEHPFEKSETQPKCGNYFFLAFKVFSACYSKTYDSEKRAYCNILVANESILHHGMLIAQHHYLLISIWGFYQNLHWYSARFLHRMLKL